MSSKHPTPWRFKAETDYEDTPIYDANGNAVLVRDSGVYPPDLDTCKEIVDGVNAASNPKRNKDRFDSYVDACLGFYKDRCLLFRPNDTYIPSEFVRWLFAKANGDQK